jgi:CBS domain-containing protein
VFVSVKGLPEVRRNKMPSVQEFMTKEVVSVKKDAPVYDALVLLRKHNVTGLPVVDDDMNLIGVITEKDVLRLLDRNSADHNKTVEFFMTQPAVSFGNDETLESVCEVMMVKTFRRVPVVSRKGKLVGIISRPDIIDYIISQRPENIRPPSDAHVAGAVEQ